MKFLFVFTYLVLAPLQSQAFDKIEYIFSTGMASGYCQPNSGFSCVHWLERDAADDAERDADWTCRGMKGQLEYAGTYACSFSSSPYLPPNHPGTFVSVSARCQYRCFISENIE